jgi:hypothetical protein
MISTSRAAPRRRGPQVEFRALVPVTVDAPGDAGVVTTAQRLGGARRWLVCPGCARRRCELYRAPAGIDAQCRVCWGLTYRTPREPRSTRLYRRAFALYDRIGTNYHVHPRQHAKPKGMHHRTYWRLRRLAERFDAAAVGAAYLAACPRGPLADGCRTLLVAAPRADAGA